MKQPDWPTTLALVKRIMDARTTKVARRTSRDGGIDGVAVRPFRARQLAVEMDVNPCVVHGWLNYGVEPREETQAKIRKWCAKHKGVLK